MRLVEFVNASNLAWDKEGVVRQFSAREQPLPKSDQEPDDQELL